MDFSDAMTVTRCYTSNCKFTVTVPVSKIVVRLDSDSEEGVRVTIEPLRWPFRITCDLL
jgi:hypothetical protein